MKSLISTIGNHVLFALEGASYAAGASGSVVTGAGTASSVNKPAANDAAWVNMGYVGDVDIEPDYAATDVHAPALGTKVRVKRVRTQNNRNYTINFSELNRLGLATVFGADPNLLTDATVQFNPGEGKQIRGWMKLQGYDGNNLLVVVAELYGVWEPNGTLKLGLDAPVAQSLKFAEEHSPLNTGTLSNALGA